MLQTINMFAASKIYKETKDKTQARRIKGMKIFAKASEGEKNTRGRKKGIKRQ